MPNRTPIEDLVEEWLRLDKNPKTRKEIQDLWEDKNIDELESRLRTRIEFGTAGLRGRMEAGWARMNDLIIIQASQGLCSYVLESVDNAADRGVVIGHDHRHHSSRWARLTAAAFIDRGVKVYLLKGLVHTPMVPFGVKHLRAACGVMITASHNPKDDNGYKVYWENAVQIIGPHDKGIATAISDNLKPRTWDAEGPSISNLCLDKTDELVKAYFAHLKSFTLPWSTKSAADVKFVNTSMHGVGDYFVAKAFRILGLPPFIAVEEQREPDPDFPTVKFPNPEEKGALNLAINTASRNGVMYVLAQDPDADRFSAAEKGHGSDWTIFTGDQLGAIFAGQILEQYKASGKPLDKLAMVASTVSSRLVEKMAESEGFRFVECLTGFKFIGNTALSLETEGYDVPFGYEEAIGFMIGSTIRDKDGVAASIYFAQIAVLLHQQGKTVRSYLQDLYNRYGHFQTKNSYFICRQSDIIDRIFARIRNYDGTATAEKPSYPQSIAGLQIISVCDLTTGYDTSNPPTYKPRLPLSSGHMIQFRAQNEEGIKIVLTIRTSGTEPKIKYYLEGNGKDQHAVEDVLARVVEVLGDEWLEASRNGLGAL